MIDNNIFKINKKLNYLIEESLKNNVFTGCCIGFFFKKENIYSTVFNSYGYTDTDNVKTKVSEKTYFDLASLTKPLVTTLVLLSLVAENKIGLDDNLGFLLGKKISGVKSKITINNLLNHSSGLPPYKPYFEKLLLKQLSIRKEFIVSLICKENLLFKPGDKTLYSDLGYILLAYIAEHISGEDLDIYWTRKIIKPLGLEKKLFYNKGNIRRPGSYVVTGECCWTKNKLSGLVNDENCRSLGGVAGHAGLFGSANGLLILLMSFMQKLKDNSPLKPNIMRPMMEILNKGEKTDWILGFDRPTPGKSSSGKYFSKRTIGHLGFTGTSFWLDIENEISVILLTNRVLFGEKMSGIKKLRPSVHNVIMEGLRLPPVC